MAPSISLLVVTKDRYDDLIGTIKDAYAVVDEIVVVDQGREEVARLLKYKQANGLKKLKVFYAQSFGYLEAILLWSIRKCSSEWILHLDADGRMSPALRSDIREIIGAKGHNGYLEDRTIIRGAGASFNETTFRLYRRAAVIACPGTIQAGVVVKGKTPYLPSKYHITHHTTGAYTGPDREKRAQRDRYLRHAMHIAALTIRHDYSYALKFCSSPTQHDSLAFNIGKWLITLPLSLSVRTKLSLHMCSGPDELSRLDYTLLAIANSLSVAAYHFALMRQQGNDALSILRYTYTMFALWELPFISYLFERKKDERADQLSISRAVTKHGVTYLLHTDQDRALKRLSERYDAMGSPDPDDFLEMLLRERVLGRK